MVYFTYDLKLRDEIWMQEDIDWNADQIGKMQHILDRQLAIQQELAVQSLRLEDIEALINRHWAQREDRFEELERGQWDLNRAISKHEGRHEALEEP